MAVCTWCAQEMKAASSCTVDAFHVDGRPVGMIAFGTEPGGRALRLRCGDCDDVPASDITTVSGIPCTTALRTVIDIAADVDFPHLEEIVHDFLDRGLFTVDEAWRRLSQPDMASRAGAALLRRVLPEAG